MEGSKELYLNIWEQISSEITAAEGGEITHLDALIRLRQHKNKFKEGIDLISQYESEHIDDIRFEADKYPEGYKGHKIEVRNGRKLWKFDHIEDWKVVKNELSELESKYKAAFDAKQKGFQFAGVVEGDDGEMEEVEMPILSYAKSSIIVK